MGIEDRQAKVEVPSPKELVKTAVFSPDGKLVASASEDNKVHFWDTATGAERYTLKPDVGVVQCAACTRNGATSVIGTTKAVLLYSTGKTGAK